MYNSQKDRDAFSRLGKQLSDIHVSELSTQLSVFQSALVNFASEHGEEIRLNAEFRTKFTELCLLIGIDPLELNIYTSATPHKRTQDFYLSLAVKIVEVCQETRDLNGGLISFKQLIPRIQSNENLQTEISEQDLIQALEAMSGLGKGYEVITIKGRRWLKFSLASSSGSITTDQKKIYEACSFMGGYVTVELLRDNYGWSRLRCRTVLDEMIMGGYLWIDRQGDGGEQYWEPSWQ